MQENMYANEPVNGFNPVVAQTNVIANAPQQIVPSFSFNVVRTDEDRILLRFNDVKKNILDNLQFNIQHYAANDWDRSNCGRKMFNDVKRIISLRSNNKTIVTVSYEPTECYSNEMKVACLKQLGKAIIANEYDKHIIDKMLEPLRNQKIKKAQKLQAPSNEVPVKSPTISPVVSSAQAQEVVKAPVKEQKPAQPTVKQLNWARNYNFD